MGKSLLTVAGPAGRMPAVQRMLLRGLFRLALILALFGGPLFVTAQLPTPPLVCDADGDNDIDSNDLNLIAAARNKPATGATDPRDPDRDGRITVIDLRICALRCTRPNCVNNLAPTANAGPDQPVFVSTTVQLNGAKSSDPEGNALTFKWKFVSRPPSSNAVLSADNIVNPTFFVDVFGTYVLELVVNDGQFNSAPDEVRITTVDSRPIARAGPGQSVKVTQKVVLNGGTSSDVDGDPLTFVWEFVSRPAGSGALLLGANTVTPSFVADRSGDYVVQLVVNDGKLDSLPSLVTVTTENSAPVANAGPDQKIHTGATVQLNGSGSTDVDGNSLTFLWSFTSRPEGSKAVIINANTLNPTFVADLPGSYIAQLIVNDGKLASEPDTVVITSENTAPVAKAGPDQTVPLGALVALDGCASADADGDLPTFAWSFTQRPAGSQAAISNPAACNPTFTADRPGTYIAQLVVRDGFVNSTPDTVVISTENSIPIADAGPDQTVDQGVTVQLNGCASNDPDGSPLTHTWSLTSFPLDSTAVFSSTTICNPTFVADKFGLYVAQLIVNDGTAASPPDTVMITANAGAAPLATDDDYSTAQGVTLTVPAPGVLANDTAAPGKTLTAQLLAPMPPAQGTLNLLPTGAFTYVPAAGFSGSAIFAYRASDGVQFSNIAIVTIVVTQANRPPSITSTAPTTATVGQPYSYQVIATDPDAGDALTFSLQTAPAGMTISPTGLIQWTPAANQHGPNNVTVRVTDKGGLFAEQSFVITVAVVQLNRPPVITSTPTVSEWTQLLPIGTPPPARNSSSRDAYDEVNDRLIVFGGQNGDGSVQFNDVWVLTNATATKGPPAWIQLSPMGTPPAPRFMHSAVYDATANRFILFGGCAGRCALQGDTWVLTNANGLGGSAEWIQLPSTAARSGHTAGYDPVSNRMIVFGGLTGGSGSDTNSVNVLVDANGVGSPEWTTLSPAGTPPPPRGQVASSVYDPLSNTLIVFGGLSTIGPQQFSDVWVLNNANGVGGTPQWRQLTPIGQAPTARSGHSIVYDPNSNRIVVFGGVDISTNPPPLFNETWVLTNANGTGGTPAWIKLPTLNTTPTRGDHLVGYARASNRMVVGTGSTRPPEATNEFWLLTNASGNCTAGQPCNYNVQATDPDVGDKLTFSLDTAPTGMSINAATGQITWTPAIAQIGANGVSVRVRDVAGAFSTQAFTITVAPVAVPNVVGLDPPTARALVGAADLNVGTETSIGGAITLRFDSLPSAQGWAYTNQFALGPPVVTTPETKVFSLSGGILNQDSFNLGTPGYYTLREAMDARLPFSLSLRARVLEDQGNPSINPFGFSFQVWTGPELFGIGLSTALIADAVPRIPFAFDNTIFHDYSLRGAGGRGFGLFVDGVLVHEGKGSPIGTPRVNDLLFGQAAGGQPHARAEVHALLFVQPRITAQNPPAGTLVPNKSNVDLTIAEGPATQTVPNVVGMMQAAASTAIVAASLTVGTITTANSATVPAGAVISQKPLAGIKVPKNHAVDLVISLGPAAGAPIITSTPITAAAVGQLYGYQVTATDSDVGDLLIFSLPTAPTGMTINSTTGLISWTPSLAQVGSHNVTVRVTDKGGLFGAQSFTVTVRSTNAAPVAIAGLLNAPGLPSCVAPPGGLVAWYPGDGNPNDIIGISSPNSKLTIGTPEFVAGKVGQGMRFDGVSGFVVLENATIDFGANDSFTIDTWVRVDGKTGVGDNAVLDKRNSLGNGYTIDAALAPLAPVGMVRFLISFTANQAGSEFGQVTTRPVPLGEYHHIAGVVDRVKKTIAIYLDGVLEQELSIASLGGALGAPSSMTIGHQSIAFTTTKVTPLIGQIDELEIFNRALLPSEIQTLFLAASAGKCKFRVGDTVRLDGTRSSDPDGDTLIYRWTLLAKPDGSAAVLSDPNVAQPSFVADKQGTYRVRLVVSDGSADSVPSEISLVVLEGNRPSIALDDDYSVKLGETLVVPPPGVVGNDFDPDANPLTTAKISDPVNGTLGFNSNGSFNYTPNSGVFGPGATAHVLVGTTFPTALPKSIDINPQTNRIYVTNVFANTLAVIDGTNGKVIALPRSPSYIEDVAVNPVTNRIYITSTRVNNYIESTLNNFNGVRVIDGATNAVITDIPIGPVFPPDIAIGHQSQHLAINSITNRIYVANVRDNSVSVIGGATNTLIATVPVGHEPRQIRIDEKLNRVYALSTLDASITVLEGTTNAAVATVPVGAGAKFMLVDPEFSRLYVVNTDAGSVSAINTLTNSVIDTIVVGPQPTSIALHPAIDRLYVTNAGGNSVTVMNRDTRAVLGTIPVGASPQSVTVNSFSNKVYVANGGANTVSVIDAGSGTVTATVPVGGDPRTILVNPITDRVYTLDAASHTVSVVHVGDRFTYKVNDGTTDSNAATVTIVIEPQVVAPVAASDHYRSNVGSTLNVVAPGVLANDADVQARPLTAHVVSAPSVGTLTLNPNGAFSYVPPTGFSGPVTFTYKANNGTTDSNIATVTILVRAVANQPPVITSTAPTTATVGLLYSYQVTATDPDVGDTLTFSLATAPAGMAINPTTGLISWTPSLAQIGSHNVAVRVADNGGLVVLQGFVIVVTATPPSQVLVPNVVGLTQSAAEESIVAAQLVVGTLTLQNSATVPSGNVISQSPTAGTSVTPKSAVNLVISLGAAADVTVPNVVGQTVTAAQTTITSAKLAVGTITIRDADEALAFDDLPSEQNWFYGAFGNSAPETTVFSVADEVLTQNTLGTGAGGLNVYQRSGVVDATKPFALTVSARVLAQNGDPADPFGFGFGVVTSTEQIAVGLRTDGIFDSRGNKLSGSIDTTQFHEYRLEQTPGVGYRLFVDGVLLATGTNVPRSTPTDPFLILGDLSGGANAHAEIRSFAFVQNSGLVIRQNPAAGASVPAGSAVDLVAVRPLATLVVPNVAGQLRADAISALVGVKLLVGTIATQNHPTVAAGRIISHIPAGGASVQEFTVVNLLVSLGTGTVPVPNVVGQTQTAAQSALTAAGLKLGTVTPQSSDTVPAGNVISQIPTAGTEVPLGTAVALIVSSGPPAPGVASIVVQPATAITITGNQVAFNAIGVLSNGSSQSPLAGVTWTSSNPAFASIDASGVATGLAAGTIMISASKDGKTGTAALRVETAVANPSQPIAQITGPVDDATITTSVPVIGTAADPEFLKFVLEIAPVGTTTFTTIGQGIAQVVNGQLGTLDPTLLINDLYTLRLTVTDRGNNTNSAEIQVQVNREKKVGAFTLAFQDLNVPMAGIPITVVRTYDSRDKAKGDFGIGWRLDINSVRLRATGIEGQGWEQQRSGSGLSQTFRIVPRRSHKVAITLPDGKVEEFDFTVSPTERTVVPIFLVTPSYTARPLTRGTLRFVDPENLAVIGSIPGEIEFARESDPTTPFQPAAYEYTTPEGQIITFQRTGSNTGTVTKIVDRNDNFVTFAPGGIIHSAGKSVTFQRDGQGRITRVTDPLGNFQTYAYDANGDLESHTDAEGNVTRFLYNFSHGLIEIRDPRGIRPVRNEYDDAGRLVKHIDAFGKEIVYTHNIAANAEIITDRLGRQTIHEYDNQGNVTQTIDAAGGVTIRTYDAAGNVLKETDPLDRARTYTYDGQDNRLTETDPLGKKTTYTYNTKRQVLTILDPLNRLTTNKYDDAGNLLSTTDPESKLTTYTYFPNGQQKTRTDALVNVTSYEYDTSGNLIKETEPAGGKVMTYTYDTNGNRITQTTTRTTPTGPQTLVTTYAYDKNNRLTQTTHADGSITRVIYNAIGKQAKTIDQLGRETSYEYDDMGRLSKTTYPDGTSESSAYDTEGRRTTSTDRAGRNMTTLTYDELGRLTETLYPDGAKTTTVYDLAGQVKESIDPRGNKTTYGYDDAGRRSTVTDALLKVTTFTYDGAGNQKTAKDANNNTTSFDYDANNRRIKVTYPDATFDTMSYDALGRQKTKTDQAGKTTTYDYDALGRLIKVTDALASVTTYTYDELGSQFTQTDAEGHTTRFEYDRLGRRTKRTLPLGQVETMTYDAAGNLKTKTDFNGRTTTYDYDSVNRLTAKTPAPVFKEPAVTFNYTATGQRLRMTDASGTTNYTYDNRDRLLTKATPQGTLTYIYDLAGNLTSTNSSNANGVSVNYEYDQRNRLAKVTDNRITAIGGGVTTYSYDDVGSLKGYVYPNDVETAYNYNSLNRLTDMQVKTKKVGNLASFTYTLGAAGNRTSVTELSGRKAEYTYDDLYRLTRETITGDPFPGSNGQIGYIYDKVGNRQTRSSTQPAIPAQSFAYDANDRIGVEAYDNNGNTTGSSGKTYAYDFENKLISAPTDGATFVYDGDGIRVAKTVSGVTTRFLVDERNLTGYAQVMEEIVAGNVQRRYTYGLKLISQTQGFASTPATHFYGYDGHGSVRLLTDAAGAVTDTYAYDAFGNQLYQTGTTPNVYLYAGEQLDGNVGLYYLRARYLNNQNGRFMAIDPIDGRLSSPTSLWTYSYANQNPVNKYDPLGLFTLPEVSVASAVQSALRAYRGLSGFQALTRVKQIVAVADTIQAVVDFGTQIYNIVENANEIPGAIEFKPLWDLKHGRSVNLKLEFKYTGTRQSGFKKVTVGLVEGFGRAPYEISLDFDTGGFWPPTGVSVSGTKRLPDPDRPIHLYGPVGFFVDVASRISWGSAKFGLDIGLVLQADTCPRCPMTFSQEYGGMKEYSLPKFQIPETIEKIRNAFD